MPENSSAQLRHEREDMAGQTSDELLALFDTAKLNARYWAIFAIMSAIIVLEFFDFGIVAFLLAVVGPRGATVQRILPR